MAYSGRWFALSDGEAVILLAFCPQGKERERANAAVGMFTEAVLHRRVGVSKLEWLGTEESQISLIQHSFSIGLNEFTSEEHTSPPPSPKV